MRIDYKAFSFDFWQTIAEPNPNYSLERSHYLSRALGMTPQEADMAYKKLKRQVDLETIDGRQATTPLWVIKRLLNELNVSADSYEIYSDLLLLQMSNLPIVSTSMYDALSWLSEKYPVCVTSNTNFIPGTVLMEVLPNSFSGYTFSDEIGVSKPEPEIFACTYALLRFGNDVRLNLDKKDVVHVGDNDVCDGTGSTNFGFSFFKVKNTKETEVFIDQFVGE